jgi:regulatory protein
LTDDAFRPSVADEERRAIEFAFRAVSHRERTEHELRVFLGERRVDPEAVDVAIEEMTALGLVDDAGYAQRFTEDRRTLLNWGNERIAHDLSRRGVRRELIDEALGGVGRGDQLTAALELLERRFPAPLVGDRDRNRAWRVLVGRGFTHELAYEAVRAHERRVAQRRAA